MRALVTGWFTFSGMGATAGDLLARDVVCEWLHQADYPFDVASSETFGGGDWRSIDPHLYTAVVFVCGPFGNGGVIPEFLARFDHCRMAGIDLTMLHRLSEWNPFDILWERDSDLTARPDIAFAATAERLPVVGLVLARRQKEYTDGVHASADDALRRLTHARSMVVVPIDTCLDPNLTGLRSAAEVESLIARMDVVLTTRLHGLVLSLKNEVPVIALDPIRGGAKVARQGEAVGWPIVYRPDEVTDADLEWAFDYCRTAEARMLARECRTRAQRAVMNVGDQFKANFKPERTISREGVRK